MAANGTPPDFDLVKYERDREHELALNQFTHNLEVEQLKLLILLNGGAAAAILTFAEHSASTARWLMLPVLFWLVGLYIGAAATLRMRKVQADFGKFYRHRRHATEFRRLAGLGKLPSGISRDELSELVRLASGEEALRKAIKTRDLSALHDRLADVVISRARTDNARVEPLSRYSLYWFMLGALVAAGVVIAGPSNPPAAAVKANLAAST